MRRLVCAVLAAHPLVLSGEGWPRVRLVAATDAALEIDAQILTSDKGEFLDVQQTLILELLQAVETAQQALSAKDTAAAHLDRH